jgi:hypothetical protein
MSKLMEEIDWLSAYWPLSQQDLKTALGTLLGTLAGGLIPFGFVLLKARYDRKEDEIAGGTRALVTLMQMWNATKQHQRVFVDPYRGRRDAWINLHVGPPLDPELSFDTKDLTFLMQKSPKVFMQVLMEGNRYRMATHLVEEHRRLAIEVVWPKLEAAGITSAEPKPDDEIKRIIGPAAVKQLEVITGEIITQFDKNVHSTQEAFTSLRAELVRLFPKTRFLNLKFEVEDTAPAPPPPPPPLNTQPYFYPVGTPRNRVR